MNELCELCRVRSFAGLIFRTIDNILSDCAGDASADKVLRQPKVVQLRVAPENGVMMKIAARLKRFLSGNSQRRWAGLWLLVTLALVVAVSLRAQVAEAAWNPAGETVDTIYEIAPLEGKVHAKLSYRLVNLDEATRNGAYYPRWVVAIPSSASNVSVVDQNYTLTFSTATEGNWTYVTVNLANKLFYGMNYSFTVNYDLSLMNGSQVSFTALIPRGAWKTAIVVPRGYYDDVSLDPKPYRVEDGTSRTSYEYYSSASTTSWVRVKAFRKGVPVSQSTSVSLSKKPVLVSVSLWEGEKENAARIIGLYSAALPVLETVTGIPFPYDYPITLTEGTNEQLNGFAGQNAGQRGITVLWSSKTDSTLLHELSHYWADRPHWAEDWMREGQASLYAYLALNRLGKEQAALVYANYRRENYDNGKNKLDLPLIDWIVPKSYSGSGQEIADFGYGKSFVFMFNLYQKIGDEGLRSANSVIFNQRTPANWFDYFDALESATGQGMRPLFLGWVVPTTLDPALVSYNDMKSTLAGIKDRLGVEGVEQKLAEARASIVKADSNAAMNNLQLTMNMSKEWKAALQSYRETEAVIAQQTETIGIQAVKDSLDKSRLLVLQGSYSQAKLQADASSTLLQEWRSALQSYRNGESAVKSQSETLGIAFISGGLSKANDLLSRGQYSLAVSQIGSTLSLLPQWQAAAQAYRNVEAVIAQQTETLGIQTVRDSLDKGKQLVLQGQYSQVRVQVDATLDLFAKWQDALQALHAAENAVAKAQSEGRTWQLGKTEARLGQAQELVASGQFEASTPKSQAVYESARNNMTPIRALLPYMAAVAAAIGALLAGVFVIRRRRRTFAA